MLKIIITASGRGKRFQDIGIKKPKYQILAKKKTLFYWSLISLKKFFKYEFIFIFNKSNYDQKFVEKELMKIEIKKYKIIVIAKVTDGQATTVTKAKKFLKPNDSILIYNIDTHIKPGAIKENIFLHDGCIHVAPFKGDHWSFAKTDGNDNVTEVSEKIRISPHASVGSYYFKKWSCFENIHKNFSEEIKNKYMEVYVCPMYQYLIDNGKKITIQKIKVSDVIPLGTPKEVKSFDPNFLKNNI